MSCTFEENKIPIHRRHKNTRQPSGTRTVTVAEHLAGAHHLRFEKAKRQQALKAAAAVTNSSQARTTEFSFVYENSN